MGVFFHVQYFQVKLIIYVLKAKGLLHSLSLPLLIDGAVIGWFQASKTFSSTWTRTICCETPGQQFMTQLFSFQGHFTHPTLPFVSWQSSYQATWRNKSFYLSGLNLIRSRSKQHTSLRHTGVKQKATQTQRVKEKGTLPSSKVTMRLKAAYGAPGLRGSTPIHRASMAARLAPEQMMLQDPDQVDAADKILLSTARPSDVL